MLLPGPWIIEGAAAVRALRKALALSRKPCDAVVLVLGYKVDPTPGQIAMGKGIATVWFGIEADVRSRGIHVFTVNGSGIAEVSE